MKEVKIEKCPYCGGEEFVKSNVTNMMGAVCVETGANKRAILFATVCRNCGSVTRLYCETPENLYPKKERKD